MSVGPQSNPKFQALATTTGAPLVGGKLYSYIPGTSTPKATYSNKTLSAANTNPVVLNSRGEADVYIYGSTDLTLKDSDNNLVWGPLTVISNTDVDSVLNIYRPENYGTIGGGNDATAIDAAIQAAAAAGGGAVKFLPIKYTLTTGLTVDQHVDLIGTGISEIAGSGANPGTVALPATPTGTILDVSGVTGVAIQYVATDSSMSMENIWVYCGPGNVASTVTKGIDVPANVTLVNFRHVTVTGCTSDPGTGAGTGRGWSFSGATGNYQHRLVDCRAYYNDYGFEFLGGTQNSVVEHCKASWNYVYGFYLSDCNAMTMIAPQAEKNGAVHTTTANIFFTTCISPNIIGLYSESTTTWPGAAIVFGGASGINRHAFITGRAIGNSGTNTKGIIFIRAYDCDVSQMRLQTFASGLITEEPTANAGVLCNNKYPQEYEVASLTNKKNSPHLNLVRNYLFDRWWEGAAAATLVGWTQSGGTLTQSTDAGREGQYCAKIVGTGAAATEVSLTQTLNLVDTQTLTVRGAATVWAKIKINLTTLSPATLSPQILIGGRGITIANTAANNNIVQWVRIGVIPTGSPITCVLKLCDSTETAAVGDELYCYAIMVVPGYEQAPGLVGNPDRDLYGQIVWNPGAASATSPGITVTGAALGDEVRVSASYDLQDNFATGYVQAANTVEIRTGVTTDLGSGTWRVRVIKP